MLSVISVVIFALGFFGQFVVMVSLYGLFQAQGDQDTDGHHRQVHQEFPEREDGLVGSVNFHNGMLTELDRQVHVADFSPTVPQKLNLRA